MANTLFIVDDDFFARQPQRFRDTTLAETGKLFAFVRGFKVVLQQPSKFPTRFDFTDSVVRVVETDGEVGAFHNQSIRKQLANIKHSLKAHRIDLDTSQATHTAGVPERGGIGFMVKEIIAAGGQKIALVVTGGAASLETAKDTIVDHLSDGRSEAEILRDRRQAIEGTPSRKGLGLGYYGKHQALVDTKGLLAHELSRKPMADWPDDYKVYVATVLARVIAHEARHQYILPHFHGGGLGASSPALWNDKNFEQFDVGDQREITVELQRLTRLQTTASIHPESNAVNQPFPF